MKPETRELIQYRLKRDRAALTAGRTLLDSGIPEEASGRIYYAMLHAALALLAKKALRSSRHSGTIALFHRHFVKTGEFPVELARQLDRAFDARMKDDYRDFVRPEPEALEVLLGQAERFIARVEEMVSPDAES